MASGCGLDMADQPHRTPLETSDFFADGQASRPLVPGTVARGHLRIDRAFFEGKVDAKPVTEFPQQTVAEHLHLSGDNSAVLKQILERGQQRFNIYCSPCHDRTGSGHGMVVQRGFPSPPSYHIDRLRNAPVGHFFDVATNGFGRMPDYASQVPPADRWAIVAYIRALQLSQHAEVSELPNSDQQALTSAERAP